MQDRPKHLVQRRVSEIRLSLTSRDAQHSQSQTLGFIDGRCHQGAFANAGFAQYEKQPAGARRAG